jgi:hypothetical protein
VSIEQRRHARFIANLPIQVSLTTHDGHVERESDRMLDVSEGGLCFVGMRYLAPGGAVKVEFSDCILEGRVKHCRLREYGAHIEFVTGVQVERVLGGQETWKSLMSVLR